jgi:hypothetical protein
MNRWAIAIALAAFSHGVFAEDDLRKLTDESRKVANDLVMQVRGELVRELELSGPLKAVAVCKYTVPEITSAISRRTGWRVTRVSLRPRNPGLAGPDAWEQKVLMEFDRRVEQGEKAETLEHAEIVQEPAGRFFRYMKALPVAPVCMTCHGPPEKMSEALRVQLANEYPFDKAVGATVGQVRGATTVKRPL